MFPGTFVPGRECSRELSFFFLMIMHKLPISWRLVIDWWYACAVQRSHSSDEAGADNSPWANNTSTSTVGGTAVGLLRFYYSISGSVLAGFSQKTAVSVFSRFRFLHEIWVKQTINYKRNNVIREWVHLYVWRQSWRRRQQHKGRLVTVRVSSQLVP